MTLPVMTIPVPQTLTRNDSLMLVSYYRWALQGLSALGFVHSRSVFLRTFSSQLVWLRSDYSLAITGFVGAEITGDDTDYGEGGLAGDESMTYDETAMHGSVKEDLFFWATFVWRLMTNDYTNQSRSASTHCWEPCCPMNGCDPSDENHHMIFSNRLNRNMFQELEEARLSSVLLKAWNSEYESADEVAEDIKAIASTMGIVVKGDEVEIDERWEAVLEVVEMGPVPHARSVRFKSSE